jgi:hypothetical protein
MQTRNGRCGTPRDSGEPPCQNVPDRARPRDVLPSFGPPHCPTAGSRDLDPGLEPPRPVERQGHEADPLRRPPGMTMLSHTDERLGRTEGSPAEIRLSWMVGAASLVL